MRTSDEIAGLFARGKREGQWTLTRKQAAWLGGAAQREAYRNGWKTEVRHATGLVAGAEGVGWQLDVYPNGAGLFRLTDVSDLCRKEGEKKAQQQTQVKATLTEMDRILASGDIPATIALEAFRQLRDDFAQINGLSERPTA